MTKELTEEQVHWKYINDTSIAAATKVMGWHLSQDKDCWSHEHYWVDTAEEFAAYAEDWSDYDIEPQTAFSPICDLNDAKMLINVMLKRGWELSLFVGVQGVEASFVSERRQEVHVVNMDRLGQIGEAITQAALMTMAALEAKNEV